MLLRVFNNLLNQPHYFSGREKEEKMALRKLLIASISALTIHSAIADEKILQNGLNGYAGCDDAYIATNTWGTIVGFFSNQNYGTATELKVSRESCCSFPTARAVIRFDLSSIPQNASIQQATLCLHVFDNNVQLGTKGTPNNSAKSLYQITEPWQENTVNWIHQPAFDSTAIASNTNTKTGVWEEYDVTSIIKNNIQNKSNNYGFMIKFPSETEFRGARIYSSECSNVELRPKLIISYTVGSTVHAAAVDAKATLTGEGTVVKTNARGVKK